MEGAMEKIAREYQERGVQQGRYETILRLLNFGKMTVEEISNMLDIPLADVQRYANQH